MADHPSHAPRTASRPRLRHVGLFLADLSGGGAERMMVQLAAGFADRGIATDLVLAEAVGPFLADVPPTVRTVRLERKGVARALPRLIGYLRRERPQVLLTTLHHTSVIAVLAVRLANVGTRVFVREANTASHKRPRLLRPRSAVVWASIRLAYRAADGVIAVSDGVAEDLHHRRGVPEERIATLYNPVVTPEVERSAREDPGHRWLSADADAPVVLAVGRLHPQKDLPTLFRSVARVHRHRRVRLIVLGEGEERQRLASLAQELGIADDVDLPGFVANPFAYMARASVFVLSSVFEGLPGALIQAMACGCPVVATDCPSGPAEILDDGRHGELVPVGDDASMAVAIERTLTDPPSAETVKRAVERFRSDTILDDYVAYLASTLDEPRSAALPRRTRR